MIGMFFPFFKVIFCRKTPDDTRKFSWDFPSGLVRLNTSRDRSRQERFAQPNLVSARSLELHQAASKYGGFLSHVEVPPNHPFQK